LPADLRFTQRKPRLKLSLNHTRCVGVFSHRTQRLDRRIGLPGAGIDAHRRGFRVEIDAAISRLCCKRGSPLDLLAAPANSLAAIRARGSIYFGSRTL